MGSGASCVRGARALAPAPRRPGTARRRRRRTRSRRRRGRRVSHLPGARRLRTGAEGGWRRAAGAGPRLAAGARPAAGRRRRGERLGGRRGRPQAQARPLRRCVVVAARALRRRDHPHRADGARPAGQHTLEARTTGPARHGLGRHPRRHADRLPRRERPPCRRRRRHRRPPARPPRGRRAARLGPGPSAHAHLRRRQRDRAATRHRRARLAPAAHDGAGRPRVVIGRALPGRDLGRPRRRARRVGPRAPDDRRAGCRRRRVRARLASPGARRAPAAPRRGARSSTSASPAAAGSSLPAREASAASRGRRTAAGCSSRGRPPTSGCSCEARGRVRLRTSAPSSRRLRRGSRSPTAGAAAPGSFRACSASAIAYRKRPSSSARARR